MKITDLRIDGFGVWSGLELRDLSAELNVFYGPNEAGKTTLMQFVRAVLYGFSPPRRQRYLPPLRGGRAGGVLAIDTPDGRFRIARHEDSLDGLIGSLAIEADDGVQYDDSVLTELLADVDESIYTNVFAVGLREIQELATLSDTQAASQLYDLTVGLDRVSLVDALREIENSGQRLLAPEDRPSQIGDLLAERAKLQNEIHTLAPQGRRYFSLLAARRKLLQETDGLERTVADLEQQSRLADVAANLRLKWNERLALDQQLAALGPLAQTPVDGVEALAAIATRLDSRRQRWKTAKHRRVILRRQVAGLKVNDTLAKQGPKIEVLADSTPWIAALEKQVAEAETEVSQLEAKIAGEQKKLGLPPAASLQLSSRMLAPLKPMAAAVRTARQRVKELKAETDGKRASAQTLQERIESSLDGRSEANLVTQLETKGELVSQLRRRAQVDERLEQMDRRQKDLNHEILDAVQRQVLPAGVLAGIGALFVLGGMLLFWKAIAVMVPPAWAITNPHFIVPVFGVGMMVGAFFLKASLDSAAADRLDSAQKQLTTLKSQAGQAKAERKELDEQLPRGGGSFDSRLKKAEQELAALEELVALDTQRQAAEQQFVDNEQQARQAGAELQAARRRWKQSVVAAGLPADLSPKQVRQLAQKSDTLADLQKRLTLCRELRDQRRRELTTFAGRVGELLQAAEIQAASSQPSEQLKQMRKQLGDQEALVKQRALLRGRIRKLTRQEADFRRDIGRLIRRRKSLLQAAGVQTDEQFKRKVETWSQAETLRRRRDELHADISDVLSGDCSADAVNRFLAEHAGQPLSQRKAEFSSQIETHKSQLRHCFQRQGELNQKVAALVEDRRLGECRLQLSAVQQRLRSAVERWQTVTITGRLLAEIKTIYEEERQPETLKEASAYLERLTEGTYSRVWTPWGENTLLVQDGQGRSLPVEVLSRGTREQLFLSLRLALAAAYARKGASLPMVLDDVLVNFDIQRTRAAANVLRDFAAAGHQLLIFTCHEHVWKLFKTLRADVRRLPPNAEFVQPALEEEPRKRKRKEPAPVVEPVPEVEASVEAIVDEPAPPVVQAIEIVEEVVAEVLPVEPEPEEEEPLGLAPLDEEPAEEPLGLLPLDDEPLPPSVQIAVELRADRPQTAPPPPMRLGRIVGRHSRWDAEEFAGELEDRVRRSEQLLKDRARKSNDEEAA